MFSQYVLLTCVLWICVRSTRVLSTCILLICALPICVFTICVLSICVPSTCASQPVLPQLDGHHICCICCSADAVITVPKIGLIENYGSVHHRDADRNEIVVEQNFENSPGNRGDIKEMFERWLVKNKKTTYPPTLITRIGPLLLSALYATDVVRLSSSLTAERIP